MSTQRTALWSAQACYAPIFGLSPGDRLLWPLPLFHSFGHSLAVLGVVATGASAHITGNSCRPVGCCAYSTRRMGRPRSTRRTKGP